MKCEGCKKEVERTSNSQRYCNKKCRTSCYYKRIREKSNLYQRERWYRKNIATKKNKIKCEVCGRSYRQVGSHITQRHGMTAREYREEYGFDVKRGQLPEDLRQHKAEKTRENGTIENLKKGKKFWLKKGESIPYIRSQQTLDRLKNNFKRNEKQTKKKK